MVRISTVEALNVFRKLPKAVSYTPKQNFKNATVKFEKIFSTGTNGEKVLWGIDKVVTRADGQVIRGHYTPDGVRIGCTQKSGTGTIETAFVGQNYDKVTTITSGGESITRLGHKGRPQSFLDSYTKGGITHSGDYSNEFNRLKAAVQAPKLKCPDWIHDLVKEINSRRK